MQLFEMCPMCCHFALLEPSQMKPMVLSGDDKEMQCDLCHTSFKLPDSEPVREMARHQREIRSWTMILRLGDTQEVPGMGVFEWDGEEFWVLEDMNCTHGELYTILSDMNKSFDIKNDGR